MYNEHLEYLALSFVMYLVVYIIVIWKVFDVPGCCTPSSLNQKRNHMVLLFLQKRNHMVISLYFLTYVVIANSIESMSLCWVCHRWGSEGENEDDSSIEITWLSVVVA